MKWVALVTWVITAGGGFALLGLWLKNGGMKQSDQPGRRIRPPLVKALPAEMRGLGQKVGERIRRAPVHGRSRSAFLCPTIRPLDRPTRSRRLPDGPAIC